MKLSLESNCIKDYLQKTPIVNYEDDEIQALADKIKKASQNELECIQKTYEYVRDQISHSADIMASTINFKASDVLVNKHGICFAKSNLLAALLRYLGIPTGFCYQRLILDDEKYPYLVLHGLNGVYIEQLQKWIRLDARGNTSGINAQFSLQEEILAFPIRTDLGEEDCPIIFTNPNINVINAMNTYKTRRELWSHLPQQL